MTINEQELKGFKFLEVQLDMNEKLEMTKKKRIENTVIYTENHTEKNLLQSLNFSLWKKYLYFLFLQ